MKDNVKELIVAFEKLGFECTYYECSEEEPFDFIIDGVGGVYIEGKVDLPEYGKSEKNSKNCAPLTNKQL